ncbi:MAG: sigma-54-dependent transcriptional regulator [Candidatus Krumholzibacteriia bacterium]
MIADEPISVLVIDDDDLVRSTLVAYLQRRGMRVQDAEGGAQGLEVFRDHAPDVVLLDLRMPGMDGLEVLRRLREEDPDLPVIVVSGAGIVNDVVDSLRLGAWDFLIKPFEDLEILLHAVRNATEQSRLRRENRRYQEELESLVRKRTAQLEAANWELTSLRARLEMENEYLREELFPVRGSDLFVGISQGLARVQRQIEQVAPTEATVLVTGESGTGKELVARALHLKSARRDRPLIKVNCASVPRELFESEFFGHVKGSYTGAVQDRVGRFQLAHQGTLFLDEVAEIPGELQVKLLRVLQEGEFERVGEGMTRTVDVRVIAATNRDLVQEIAAGRFREDLYYRLNVFPIVIPPLRERKDDIPPLVQHFLTQACRKFGRSETPLKIRHVVEMQGYDWPGNVRELQNFIERAVITSSPGSLRIDLEGRRSALAQDAEAGRPTGRAAGVDAGGETVSAPEPREGILTEAEMKARERANIIRALQACGWQVSGPTGAARLLGVKSSTLTSRMKVMNIEKPRRAAEGKA